MLFFHYICTMRILLFLNALITYFAIVIERIYLIPFSNVLPSDMDSVLLNRKDAERLWSRFWIGSIIYGVILILFLIS